MAEEMDRRQTELNEAQEMIRRLEEQLRQLQDAKEELENRQQVSVLFFFFCQSHYGINIKGGT